LPPENCRFRSCTPKNQRPELWNIYNTKINRGESIRVFPLSDWTELDVWRYIQLENIPIVPLYFAKKRPVVKRGNTWIMVDDERMRLDSGEQPVDKNVRFRTLGCYPLTGAVESEAETIEQIVQEMLLTTSSERQGRVIDYDGAASMEEKKRDGTALSPVCWASNILSSPSIRWMRSTTPKASTARSAATTKVLPPSCRSTTFIFYRSQHCWATTSSSPAPICLGSKANRC